MSSHQEKITLKLWKDLTPLQSPRVSPDTDAKHVLVIGGGVTGLVTTWVLLDHGYKVTILAKEWASYTKDQRLTSQIAGALWEFPPAVCGSHTDVISLLNSKRWCMGSYRLYNDLAADPVLSAISGVRMKPSGFFFPQPIEQDAHELGKMKEIMASGVRGFRRGLGIVEQRRVNPTYGMTGSVADAYEILSPIIDTDMAMTWLMGLVQGKGATFVTETIHDDLLMVEKRLLARFSADAIVNCTGLNGTELAGDKSCYPIRGGLVRVMNDGRHFPKVESALTITADAAHNTNEIVFIVPRNDNILLIGGIAQPHEWELNLSLESPIIKRMRQRCEDFLPDLINAKIDLEYPLAQGLRPFRSHNVRVERELRSLDGEPSMITHSYGQGGAGWSLAFGCAGDVLQLITEALQGQPTRSMEDRAKSNRGKNMATSDDFCVRL
ncbi:hypothetical protein N0V93_002139 [Gnomoniopsis smithogilvyi]|uniref:FAD dependent oxidoreductase domain-containing protein n=1 Tax=Gnomoniopsis smithogilvyi TaxID=1191159 RepID=A0A9W9CXF0_9PEZI|nr:hypothetical protein N0V93_002139 [Gnomoniopsis smithogilvyi]